MNKKSGNYFQPGTWRGALEAHVLWSVFCKWPVINVTLLTLKIQYTKYKTNMIYLNDINEIMLLKC